MTCYDPDLAEVLAAQALLEGYHPRNTFESYQEDARYLLQLAGGDSHLANAVLHRLPPSSATSRETVAYFFDRLTQETADA